MPELLIPTKAVGLGTVRGGSDQHRAGEPFRTLPGSPPLISLFRRGARTAGD
jgi:hypothetical protein